MRRRRSRSRGKRRVHCGMMDGFTGCTNKNFFTFCEGSPTTNERMRRVQHIYSDVACGVFMLSSDRTIGTVVYMQYAFQKDKIV